MDPNDSPGRDRRSVLKAAGALGAFVGSSGLATASDEPSDPTELLVGVSPSVDVESTVASALGGEADVVHTNDVLGYATIELPDSAPDEAVERIEEALEGVDAIEYVEANGTLEAFRTPNDPSYSDQYAPQRVDCEDAWETTFGESDVVISVVDQGVAYDHENLEANVDDRVGAVFVGGGSDPSPVNSNETHGTIVAGIANGVTNNGVGHAGISNCSMLSARALDERGSGSLADIADAIQWSADEGVDVINLSLGSQSGWNTLENACRYARDQGCLLVAAAGNDGSSVAYPARYETVLAVSALDSNDRLASFSNRGAEIDLAAPGVSVLSTTLNDGYTRASGTSMAAPIVAGVAGLVRSAYPDLSPEELQAHLETTAQDVGLSAQAQGAGRVDAGTAVTTAPDGYEPEEPADDPEEPDDSEEPDEDEENEEDEETFEYAVEANEDEVEYFLEGVDGVDFTAQEDSRYIYVSEDGTRAAGRLEDGERHAFDGILVETSTMLDVDIRGDGDGFIDGNESALGWYPRDGASGDDWKDLEELLDLDDDGPDDDDEPEEPDDDDEPEEPDDDDEPEEPDDDDEPEEPDDDDEPEEPHDDDVMDDPIGAWRDGDITLGELRDILSS